MHACGRSYRHAPLVLREWPRRRWRPGRRVRPEAGREWDLFLGEWLAPVLREPHLEPERPPFRRRIQRLRGDRRLPDRQRAGGCGTRQERLDAAGDQPEAVLDNALAQGSELGGKSFVQW